MTPPTLSSSTRRVSTRAAGLRANSVYIETKNPGGGLTDGIPFHLAVVCPNAVNTKVLVGMANGFAKRGSALTSSFRRTTGNYVFVTNVNLAPCTMIGTRGSSNTAVPFNPSTVEIAPGPAPEDQRNPNPADALPGRRSEQPGFPRCGHLLTLAHLFAVLEAPSSSTVVFLPWTGTHVASLKTIVANRVSQQPC